MNYTQTAKANDERRLANEAMFDRMERREVSIRYGDWPPQGCFGAYGSHSEELRQPDHTNTPHLTVEAAKARISAIREIADEWQYSHEGLNPKLFENELARLLAFIAHNP